MTLISLLEDEEVKNIVKWKARNYQKGDVIIEQDSPGSELFLICKGSVNILASMHITEDRQEEKVIGTLETEDCFGEMALFSEDLRSATISAAEECEIAIIDGTLLLTYMDEHPEKGYIILRGLFKTLVDRMRNNNDRANAIMSFYLRETG